MNHQPEQRKKDNESLVKRENIENKSPPFFSFQNIKHKSLRAFDSSKYRRKGEALVGHNLKRKEGMRNSRVRHPSYSPPPSPPALSIGFP